MATKRITDRAVTLLPDYAQDLATVNHKVHSAHGLGYTFVGVEVGFKVFYFKKRIIQNVSSYSLIKHLFLLGPEFSGQQGCKP